MKCPECTKELFFSEHLARNAAVLYSWKFGKTYRVYECPTRAGDYHLSTKPKKKQKKKMYRGVKAV